MYKPKKIPNEEIYYQYDEELELFVVKGAESGADYVSFAYEKDADDYCFKREYKNKQESKND